MKKIILVTVLFFSCGNKNIHEDYYKYPYLVKMTNKFYSTGILVDSFKMNSRENIVIYKDGAVSVIYSDVINVKQNEYFKK